MSPGNLLVRGAASLMAPSDPVAAQPRVRLLGTAPAERRVSMESYAHHLWVALGDLGVAAQLHVPPHGLAAHAVARYWRRYVRYQLAARSLKADITHLVDHGYGHLVYSLDAARTVVTFHDAMLLKLAERSLPTAYRPRFTILGHRLSLAGIARAARVIAISESARADLLAYTRIRPERVVVIPLGVEPRFFAGDGTAGPGARIAARSAAPTRTILHVGSCVFYKNIETILRALPLATRLLGGPITFLKAGAPFTPDQQALIAGLGLDDRVQHMGFVPAEALPGLYRRADALVFPSLYEGFGLPVLEAMASGLPVITAATGALSEVVGDTAVCVDPLDTAGLARSIAEVLADPMWQADLACRGQQRARRFTWEETARRTLAVYRDVLREAGSRTCAARPMRSACSPPSPGERTRR